MAAEERRSCALETVERVRPPPWPEAPGAASNAPAWKLACAAASARSARRAGIHGQRDGALQERGRRGDSAASLRPAGRTLELGGDFLARSRRRSGAVPGAPVRVRLGVGCFGEGAMDAVAVVGGGRAVGGGPDEWVRELDAPTYSEQTRVHCRVGRSHVDAERLGGTVEQQRVAERLCGRGEDEQLRLGREAGGAAGRSSVRSC